MLNDTTHELLNMEQTWGDQLQGLQEAASNIPECKYHKKDKRRSNLVAQLGMERWQHQGVSTALFQTYHQFNGENNWTSTLDFMRDRPQFNGLAAAALRSSVSFP